MTKKNIYNKIMIINNLECAVINDEIIYKDALNKVNDMKEGGIYLVRRGGGGGTSFYFKLLTFPKPRFYKSSTDFIEVEYDDNDNNRDKGWLSKSNINDYSGEKDNTNIYEISEDDVEKIKACVVDGRPSISEPKPEPESGGKRTRRKTRKNNKKNKKSKRKATRRRKLSRKNRL
jgi:hypothetical protein